MMCMGLSHTLGNMTTGLSLNMTIFSTMDCIIMIHMWTLYRELLLVSIVI